MISFFRSCYRRVDSSKHASIENPSRDSARSSEIIVFDKRETVGLSNKIWYATAVTVGFIALGVLAFGIMGLLQAHGINIPGHLSSALNALSTPHSWGFWLMGSLGAAGVITVSVLLGKDLRACRPQKQTVENATTNREKIVREIQEEEIVQEIQAADEISKNEKNLEEIKKKFGDFFEENGILDQKAFLAERLGELHPGKEGIYLPKFKNKEKGEMYILVKFQGGEMECTRIITIQEANRLSSLLQQNEIVLSWSI